MEIVKVKRGKTGITVVLITYYNYDCIKIFDQ